jgi:hypothetical protein
MKFHSIVITIITNKAFCFCFVCFLFIFYIYFTHLLFILIQDIDKSTIKYVGPQAGPINSMVNLPKKKKKEIKKMCNTSHYITIKSSTAITLIKAHLHLLGVICQLMGIAIEVLTIDSSNRILALKAP